MKHPLFFQFIKMLFITVHKYLGGISTNYCAWRNFTMYNRTSLNDCAFADFCPRQNSNARPNPNKIANDYIFANIIIWRIRYMLPSIIIMISCNNQQLYPTMKMLSKHNAPITMNFAPIKRNVIRQFALFCQSCWTTTPQVFATFTCLIYGACPFIIMSIKFMRISLNRKNWYPKYTENISVPLLFYSPNINQIK